MRAEHACSIEPDDGIRDAFFFALFPQTVSVFIEEDISGNFRGGSHEAKVHIVLRIQSALHCECADFLCGERELSRNLFRLHTHGEFAELVLLSKIKLAAGGIGHNFLRVISLRFLKEEEYIRDPVVIEVTREGIHDLSLRNRSIKRIAEIRERTESI